MERSKIDSSEGDSLGQKNPRVGNILRNQEMKIKVTLFAKQDKRNFIIDQIPMLVDG
jgi:hypothetical protein